MKYSLISKITGLCVLSVSAVAWADQVTIDQVPVAVRNSVNSQAANSPVKKIERLNRNGKTVYEVGFAQPGGLERDVYIDENGLFVQGNAASRPLVTANPALATNAVPRGKAFEITLKEVPDPVQKTINTEIAKGPIRNIEQMFLNGRTVYKVAIQQPGAPDKLIYLNTDGSYVHGRQADPGLLARTQGRAVPVNLADLPTNVRNTINSETSNGPVKKIEDVPFNGRTVYKIAYQQPGGGEKLIYLNHDGSYVQDHEQTGIGASATSATASRSSLSNSTKVTLDQVPVAVQNSLKTNARGVAIEDIDKGTLDGKTVYEAAFKQGGNTVELRVDEQGRIIQDAEDRSILSGEKH